MDWGMWRTCGLLLGLWPALVLAEVPSGGQVVRVIDGDTLALADGTRVRLLDINAPELAHQDRPAEPFSSAAKQALEKMVLNRSVTLEVGRDALDDYDRVLAHVYLADGPMAGGWVNGGLVRSGLATVYTFAGNTEYPRQLQALEAPARANRWGLWSRPERAVRDAATCCAAGDVGQFRLVQGVVQEVQRVRSAKGERVYLNFGSNWRQDFSVMIADKDLKWFRQAGIKNVRDYYQGRRVLVRGFLTPINGVQVRVTHPAQLELLP